MMTITKHRWLYVNIISKVKLVTLIEGDLKAPFSIATTPIYSYLIVLSAKQGSIK